MKKKAVIAIINNNGKILLGKKRSDSGKFMAGKWHLLAENVEQGETDEQALIRGIFEETGIKIKVKKYLASYPTPTGKLAKFYECIVLNKEIVVGSDLEDAKWVDKREVLDIYENKEKLLPKEVLEYFKD